MNKNILKFDNIDTSHIPYVDYDEQKEIEELLKNEDCNVIDSNIIYDFDSVNFIVIE